MSFDSANRWAVIRTLIAGLWPAWNVTPEQAQEWKSALAGRNAAAVDQAVRAHYRESKWKEPRLAAILFHFRRIMPTHDQGANHEALDTLKRKWEGECRASQMSMLRALKTLDAAELRRAMEYAAHREFICVQNGDLLEWSPMAVGMVHALLFDPPTERLKNWRTEHGVIGRIAKTADGEAGAGGAGSEAAGVGQGQEAVEYFTD